MRHQSLAGSHSPRYRTWQYDKVRGLSRPVHPSTCALRVQGPCPQIDIRCSLARCNTSWPLVFHAPQVSLRAGLVTKRDWFSRTDTSPRFFRCRMDTSSPPSQTVSMRQALGEFNFLGRATDNLHTMFTTTLAGTGTTLVVEALAMPGTPGAAAEVTHPALVKAIATELDSALRQEYRQNLDAVEARFRAARLEDAEAAKVAGDELERLFAVIHSPLVLVHARGTNHDHVVPINDRFVPIRDHFVPDMLDKLIDVFPSSFISRAPPGPYNERRYIITALPECFHELMTTTLWLVQT